MTEKITPPDDEKHLVSERLVVPQGRRAFLKWSSAAALTAFAYGATNVPAFSPADPFRGLPVQADDREVDLGKGDIGVLNYAYALEQLEAAFYTQALSSRFSGMTDAERVILTDIRDHEVSHREFFKAALGKDAIPALRVNFTKIDFNSRASVLGTARTFEDLGVSAYNGAGQLLKNGTFLLLAGKIVSVEARHAAIIRELLAPRSAAFSGDDVVDAKTGLDKATKPSDVLKAAGPFIATKIKASGLPKP